MALIYETPHFTVESHETPEVDRLDGGHIKINPKRDVEDRTHLTPREAIDLMRLTIVAGRAMKVALAKEGINIGRINYQDNGNWKPHLHVHLYGRARDAQFQKFGDPITPGHRPEYRPLTPNDIQLIRDEIVRLMANDDFSDETWGMRG